ncbi:MAG TPA: hypothetical protein VLX61_08035 [Anaerolineales bacterium]|nr:hypothetical protein [Anaerolineales bacterium]
MSSTRLKALRILVVAILVLLAVQYEFGMAVNMANPPSLSPFSFSIPQISDALHHAGEIAWIHAILGAWLVILSIPSLILSLRSGLRSAQVLGVLSFLTVVFAAGGGLFFVLSGFQDDQASHTMATNFLLSFAFFFLELYAIKPAKGNSPPAASQG